MDEDEDDVFDFSMIDYGIAILQIAHWKAIRDGRHEDAHSATFCADILQSVSDDETEKMGGT